MALVPPTSRVFDQQRKPDRDCWLSLALGLFLLAFLGLVADTVREVRLKGGALEAETSSQVPHLSKREPVRAISAETRREGAASPSWDSAGGILPATAIPSIALCNNGKDPGAWCSSRGPSGSVSASFQPRAPPLSA